MFPQSLWVSLRQESSRKEEVTRTRKPFIATLRVNESRPAELGQQPEASLAWGGVTLTAKRSESQCLAIEPRNTPRGSLRRRHMRGPCRHAAMAWRVRSYRGPRTGRRDTRGAREPESPVRLH